MKIQPTQINFGYHSRLMEEYRNGNIKLKKDIYGNPITPKTASHDHIIPHSKGGWDNISNYVLANKWANNKRGVRPFSTEVRLLPLLEYLYTMMTTKTEKFDGAEYAKKITRTIIQALKEGK